VMLLFFQHGRPEFTIEPSKMAIAVPKSDYILVSRWLWVRVWVRVNIRIAMINN
jgi:hypothetical protein